jgi:hypothetical protein
MECAARKLLIDWPDESYISSIPVVSCNVNFSRGTLGRPIFDPFVPTLSSRMKHLAVRRQNRRAPAHRAKTPNPN